MKMVLILDGSPRKNGKMSQVLRAMEKSRLLMKDDVSL